MKMGNPRQKMYTNALTKALIKESDGAIPESEATIASQGITKTLLKAGDSLNMKTVMTTARFVVKQKTRYEDGELVYVPGEGIIDQSTNDYYSSNTTDKERV